MLHRSNLSSIPAPPSFRHRIRSPGRTGEQSWTKARCHRGVRCHPWGGQTAATASPWCCKAAARWVRTQAGVYQALHEAKLEPDWIAGVSIGGINGAIIAGNPPEQRLERLRQFWETITARPTALFVPDGDNPRRLANMWSSMLTMTLGQPGFFTPNVPNPWISPRGSATSTSFYDNAPLYQTLRGLVDFDYLNNNGVRYACGAVNVRSGNFAYFDTAETIIEAQHVMASGALPPALPMMQVGTDWFWDGGLVSNTPLQHVFENLGATSTLVFQVDLFSARGPLPRDMGEVLARQKGIQVTPAAPGW